MIFSKTSKNIIYTCLLHVIEYAFIYIKKTYKKKYNENIFKYISELLKISPNTIKQGDRDLNDQKKS